MEVKDLQATKTSPWIECQSKTIPGKKYLFNKMTGERKWLSPTKDYTQSPPNDVKKVLKTPANDRLKRLRRYPQNPRALDNITKDKSSAISEKISQKNDKRKPTDKQKSKNPTSLIKKTEKSALTPKGRLKEKIKNAKELESKEKTQESKKTEIKKVATSVEPQKCDTATKKSNEDKQKSLHQNSVNIKRFKIPKKTEQINAIKEIKTTPTIIKNLEIIKEQNKIVKKVAKKDNNIEQKIQKQVDKSAETSSDSEILTPKKSTAGERTIKQEKEIALKDIKDKLNTQKIKNSMEAINTEFIINNTDTTAGNRTVLNASSLNLPSLKFLTSCISTPLSHLKRKANERLRNFRQSLPNDKITQPTFQNVDKNSNTFTTPANTECEEMDWEPSIESPSNLNFDTPENNCLNEQTEMEIDENLMLNAADKTTETSKPIKDKWLKNHLYIVLDTNIFIHHLDFIEVLKSFKPADANATILYLPYCVLQELDKLKLRENIQSQVIRAIKYLNKIFETKDPHIQAQNALENCRRLIEIESCDDNILNACLQVREHIPNLILFSEDVNLRNKAMCNDIKVLTKKDFLKISLQTSQKLF